MLVGTNDNITLGVFLYTCHAALQELLFRGGLLAGFYHFLPGSKFKRGFDSILITNALFMATHTHLSIFFSLVAFVLGLIWGLLFLKQESLVGPIVAHIIIGNMTMFYFGLPHYFL